MASYAATLGEATRALTLDGAAQEIRYTIGMPLSEAAQTVIDNMLHLARQVLNEQEAAKAWEQGRKIDMEDVVQYALGEINV